MRVLEEVYQAKQAEPDDHGAAAEEGATATDELAVELGRDPGHDLPRLRFVDLGTPADHLADDPPLAVPGLEAFAGKALQPRLRIGHHIDVSTSAGRPPGAGSWKREAGS